MILYFLCMLSNSKFIGTSHFINGSIKKIDRIDYLSFVNNGSSLVMVCFFESQRNYENMMRILEFSQKMYVDNVQFRIIDEDQAYDFEIPPPFIVFCVNRTREVFPFPEGEIPFLSLLELILFPYQKVLVNKDELFSRLGDTSYTIISSYSSLEQIIPLIQAGLIKMGSINAVHVESSLLNEMGINGSVALYREEDRSIVPINNTYHSLFEASYPVYRVLTPGDFETEKDIFIIVTRFDPKEMVDYLYEIGVKYPSIIFGVASPGIYSMISSIIGEIEISDYRVHFLNYQKKYYYNIEQYFTPHLLNASFCMNVWNNITNQLMCDYYENMLTPVYISEAIPEEKSIIERVVGKTYKKFIYESKQDIVFLYIRPSCSYCQSFMKDFYHLSENLHPKLSFAYINIEKNSCELPFPFRLGVPHIEFFPANTSLSYPHFGSRDYFSVIRFITKYSTQTLHIVAPKLSEEEFFDESFHIMSIIEQYPDSYHNIATEYIQWLKQNYVSSTDEL